MNANKLRGLIAEAGTSQPKVAKALGIAGNTFYKKMKRDGGFTTAEAEDIAKLLGLSDEAILDAFFPNLRPAAGTPAASSPAASSPISRTK